MTTQSNMEQNNITNQPQKQTKEIDILGIITKVLKEFKLLATVVCISALIGVIVALNTSKSYTSNVVLAPELNSGRGMASNLSDLASMVGVNLSASSSSIDAIYPEIYPDIVSSTDFIVNLFNIKVHQLKDKTTAKTYFNHLIEDVHIPFWNYPKIWLGKLLNKEQGKGNGKLNPFQLTKTQTEICSVIRSNISCAVDKKTSVITISVKDFDPLVAAVIADTVQNRLQQYVTLYRTKKARNDLDYTKKLFDQAKANYIKARQVYGAYSDANTDIVLQSYKLKQNDLENDMQLKYNIYTQLAQQLQLAQAKVQERTPAYSIIQNASVPLKASSTPRLYIVLLFIALGIFFDTLWITLLRDASHRLLKKKTAV